MDLAFLKTGVTSRAEVQDKLKAIDTGVDSKHFFVGRWDTSKWGAWVVLAGYGGAVGNAGRVWRDQNLLIEFDDTGVVKSYETFSDKLFMTKIAPIIREAKYAPQSQLDVLVSFDSRYYRSAKLVLRADAFEFTETRQTKKPFHFRVSTEWLENTRAFLRASGDAIHVTGQLHFATNLKKLNGPRTKTIYIESTIPQLITLLRYTSQRG